MQKIIDEYLFMLDNKIEDIDSKVNSLKAIINTPFDKLSIETQFVEKFNKVQEVLALTDKRVALKLKSQELTIISDIQNLRPELIKDMIKYYETIENYEYCCVLSKLK